MIQVLRTGPLALVMDAGRPGYAAVGVSPSGAFDRAAFDRGAELVGNDPAGPAGIEIVLGGFSVRALVRGRVALTGTVCPVTVDGREAVWDAAFDLDPGQVLSLGMPGAGLRSYLSIAGGVDAEPVLGSRSTDLLSGLGPPPLVAGDQLGTGLPLAAGEQLGTGLPLAAGEQLGTGLPLAAGDQLGTGLPLAAGEQLGTGLPLRPAVAGRPPRLDGDMLDLLPGPQADWLASRDALATTWTVSPNSNRVGVRLDGPPLARRAGEIPSQPLVRGAVQLPPSGLPVVFGPDHPTTGGYPVVAVLTDDSCDRLAQLRPGLPCALRWVGRG